MVAPNYEATCVLWSDLTLVCTSIINTILIISNPTCHFLSFNEQIPIILCPSQPLPYSAAICLCMCGCSLGSNMISPCLSPNLIPHSFIWMICTGVHPNFGLGLNLSRKSLHAYLRAINLVTDDNIIRVSLPLTRHSSHIYLNVQNILQVNCICYQNN